MNVVFEVYGNGQRMNKIVVEARDGVFRNEEALIKEVKYLMSEFKTHCYATGGAYHIQHFINYINKYTSLRATNGLPQTCVRIDM